jgi:hypothetical protein
MTECSGRKPSNACSQLDSDLPPVDVLTHDDFLTCTKALGGEWTLKDNEEGAITHNRHDHTGSMPPYTLESHQRDYEELREELRKRVEESGIDEATLRTRVESGIEPEAA